MPALGLRNRLLFLGLVHQSNGRAEPLSRSWNRIHTEIVLDRDRFAMSLKPWYRIPEPAAADNNPDIGRYMGLGEAAVSYDFTRIL